MNREGKKYFEKRGVYMQPAIFQTGLYIRNFMSGGLKLIFRCSLLPPFNQSAALIDGSHVTVVSGYTSSWKYSFCKEIVINANEFGAYMSKSAFQLRVFQMFRVLSS
jgi:hypothetical protein